MKTVNISIRKHYIDWLRVVSVLLLIPFHVAYFILDWHYHFDNNKASFGFVIFAFFLAIWHMPILFFISGIGQWHATKYRSKTKLVLERVKRLFIPLVFGILVVVPPQTYVERLQKLQFTGSYLEFYPNLFNGIYLNGNFTWNHLWFLAYLFVFLLLALPILYYLRKPSGLKIASAFISFFEKGRKVFLLGIPFFCIEFFLRSNWPSALNLIQDWANFWFFLVLFLLGYLLSISTGIWTSIEGNRKVALVVGIFLTVLTCANYYIKYITTEEYWLYATLLGLRGVAMWCWLIALIGFAKKHLDYSNKFLGYFNGGALPMYIIHQTFVFLIGYYILKLKMSMFSNFLIMNIIVFILTIGTYEIIKRVRILRLMFGMKNK